MPKLFTTGYSIEGWTSEKLHRVAREKNAIVLDIRFSPYSKVDSEWNRKSLQMVLGKDYLWCKALGNRNYKKGRIEIHDPNAGIEMVESIFSRGKSVILLCTCPKLMSCHRYHVAQMLVECLQVTYQEIKPPSAQLALF